MLRRELCLLLAALGVFFHARAADLKIVRAGTNTSVRIDGDPDNDWRLETATNPAAWTTFTNFGTLLASRDSNALWRSFISTNPLQFYRAQKSEGLYDPSLFRAINLVFTQANWTSLLASARTTGSNVYCSLLWMNNSASNAGVGARYKGNTSYTAAGAKKSFNIEINWPTDADRLMGYSTINLNNAFGDETIMREPLYFTVMSRYAPCPRGAMARVHVNGSLWGVFSLAEQENGQLVSEWFPSNDGDRWRTPNAPLGGGGPGGGMFSGSNSALSYLGTTNLSPYLPNYTLMTTNSPTNAAWARLINAIQVLNTTPTNELRERVEDVLAVDNWLWFLALENIFADDDSYWNKGADYSFYYEIESGRFHPLEHDGNEAITVPTDVTLSPVAGATGTNFNRPLLFRLLPVNELRQRYLAHLRTVLEESFNPVALTPLIDRFRDLSIQSIIADPIRGFTMAAYTNDLLTLRNYITNRHGFLTNHAELRPLPPNILAVFDPAVTPGPAEVPFVTAHVTANGTNGLGSVWLYFRDKTYGRFTVRQMFDDGAHGDDLPGDGLFGAATTNFPAGNRIHYYVEARSANAAQAAAFHPARAENDTHAYRVGLATATNTPLVINEFMASNASTLADAQGEFDDWIELHNLTDTNVDLTGRYLTDDATNPRKWAFPAGTVIPPDGYLLVWADEDSLASPGLHANFKLSGSGEAIYLIDTEASLNAVLDAIAFGAQTTDISLGRSGLDADVWIPMAPTPGTPNH